MFNKIKQRRIYEVIANEMRDAIIDGTLKSGDKLPSEMELAESFGVGRPAVREALRTLEVKGLVAVRHGKDGGTFVKKQDLESISHHVSDLLRFGRISLTHLAEARILVEGLIFKVIAEKLTQHHIDELRKTIAITEEMYSLDNQKERIRQNFEFHTLLASITENPILMINVAVINDMMSYYLVKIKPSKQTTLNTINAHKRIVDLLEDRNFEACEEENRKHINDVNDRLLDKLVREKKGEISESLVPTFKGGLL